jgi:hypothetical protein
VNGGGRMEPGCGRTRFASRLLAEKAVGKGAEGEPYRCTQGRRGPHWHAGVAPEVKAKAAPRRQARDTGPSKAVRAAVLARDGFQCVCCGRSVIGQVYSLQHRKRRSQGGGSLASNLITVLGDGTTGCHQRIDSRIDPADEAQGYTVRSWDDPALIPVVFHSEHGSGFTAWLADDGGLLFDDPAIAGAA